MISKRQIFLLLGVVSIVTLISGVFVLTGMEYQAGAALPPEEQTAETIYRNYDGAVCLACDYGRMFIAILGPIAFVTVLSGWGIDEIGSRVLVRIATPK